MALKYWYKAGNSSDNWSTVTNWWTTSGGPTTGGVNAGLPGTFDDVIFDSLSTTSATVTIVTTGALCNSINFTGFTGTLAGNTVGLQITNSLPVTESSDTPLFAWGSGMTVSFSGTVTFGVSGTGSGGWIYCNGKTFQGPVTFLSPSATFTFKDVFRTSSAGTGALVTLTSGTILATEADVEFGRFTSIGTAAKNISCTTNLYLTGTGALYTLGTNSTNLTSTITNLIVSNGTTTAKTLLFNAQFGSTNLQLAGAGSISIALGTTFKPAVTVTNTGGATAIFNMSASSTITSLTFGAGVGMTWTNTASITVTILNDLTLVSSLAAPTLTPLLIFANPDGIYSNITLAGKSLVTGTLTLSAGSYANFLDSVSTNAAININGEIIAYNNISTSSTVSVGTSGNILMYGSSITATTTTIQGLLTMFANLSVTGAITLNASVGGGTLNTNTYSLICSGTITLQNVGVLLVIGSCQANAITSTNGAITVNEDSTLTCTNVLSISAGSISAAGTNSPIYAGSFATSGSGVKDINIIDLYLTGTGALYAQTTASNITTAITNIYITSNLPAARSLTYNTVFGSANVYVSNSSSGTTTLALGTFFIPSVYINNTTVSTLTFTSCNVRSLEFITGTVVNWNNATSQTLTVVEDFKLAASMTVTATPAILFNNIPGDGVPQYVYMNGQSLKSTLTINDGGSVQTNVYFKDDFISTSSINISNAGTVAIERNFTATTFTSSLWTSGNINIGYNFSTNTIYPSVVNLTSITSSTTNGTKLILHSGSIICSGAIALSTDMIFIIGDIDSSTVSCTSFTFSTGSLLVLSRGSITCSGTFSTANGTLYLGRNNVGVPIPNISEVNITCSTFSVTGTSSAILDNANIINRITCRGTGTVFSEGSTNGALSSSLTVLINNTNNPTSNTTFSGGTTLYRELIFDRGGSTAINTVNNSNTFTNLRDWGTAAHILQFGGGTTNFIDGAFDVKGSSGNLITLQRSSAVATFLQRGKGLVLCDYVTVILLNALDYDGGTAIGVWYSGPNSTVTSSTGWNTGGKVRQQSALGVG